MKSRRVWTKKQDCFLEKIHEENPHKTWGYVSKKLAEYGVGKRTQKQCRDRYQIYLKPGQSSLRWGPQEEDRFLFFQSQYGNKWSKIAKQFPGRNGSFLKNQFYSKLRKSIRKLNHSILSYHLNGENEIPLKHALLIPTQVTGVYNYSKMRQLATLTDENKIELFRELPLLHKALYYCEDHHPYCQQLEIHISQIFLAEVQNLSTSTGQPPLRRQTSVKMQQEEDGAQQVKKQRFSDSENFVCQNDVLGTISNRKGSSSPYSNSSKVPHVSDRSHFIASDELKALINFDEIKKHSRNNSSSIELREINSSFYNKKIENSLQGSRLPFLSSENGNSGHSEQKIKKVKQKRKKTQKGSQSIDSQENNYEQESQNEYSLFSEVVDNLMENSECLFPYDFRSESQNSNPFLVNLEENSYP